MKKFSLSFHRPYFALQPPELFGRDISNVGKGNALFVVFDVGHRIAGFRFYPGDHIHIGSNLVHVDLELVERAFGITGIRHDSHFQMLWIDKVQLVYRIRAKIVHERTADDLDFLTNAGSPCSSKNDLVDFDQWGVLANEASIFHAQERMDPMLLEVLYMYNCVSCYDDTRYSPSRNG